MYWARRKHVFFDIYTRKEQVLVDHLLIKGFWSLWGIWLHEFAGLNFPVYLDGHIYSLFYTSLMPTNTYLLTYSLRGTTALTGTSRR
jgi:hypothetical protein